MTLTDLFEAILSAIPIVGFVAAVVAAVVYVRYKGTVEALKETVDTYERLAAGYKEEAEALRDEVKDLKDKVTEMESEMKSQALAFEKLTEKFIDSLKYGTCIYSESCPNYKHPSRVSD